MYEGSSVVRSGESRGNLRILLRGSKTLSLSSVLIESPSDPIGIGVLESLGARCIAAPVDANGMNVEIATELVQRFRPKIIVTSSTGRVPTCVTMPTAKRRQLVEMAAANRTLIVEYDLSAEISYDATPPKPLKCWDRFGCVVYVRAFSRITAAGFRMSCLTVEGPSSRACPTASAGTSSLSRPLRQWLSWPTSPADHSNAMSPGPGPSTPSTAMRRRAPTSGFRLWLSLPPTVSARELTNEAALRG